MHQETNGTHLCMNPLYEGIKHDLDICWEVLETGLKGDMTKEDYNAIMNYCAALLSLRSDLHHADYLSNGIPDIFRKYLPKEE